MNIDQLSLSLIFIDATLSDYEILARGVTGKSSVFIIKPEQDGITEITRAIAQHPDTDAIHILSHGSPGSIYLGNSQLNLDTLSQYSNQLQTWQVKEILLYGCNVAAGDAGAEFITKLQGITKASIAATQTLTGNAELGGNWDLEVTLGEINSQSVVTEEARKAYTGVMATYRVDTLQDENDGIDVGNVSLREAVNAANDNPGADTIRFEPFLTNGTIALNSGLSIVDDLTIIGDGTIKISGRNSIRPFYIDQDEVVTLEGIQIVNGSGFNGGGIEVDGNLTLINSIVANNFADDDGGGIYVDDGGVEIINTHIFNNSADDGGGGIFISRWASPSKIINSTINNNSAAFGGGIRNTGNLEIINSTISSNTATTNDGGLGNGGLVSIVNTTITENTAPADETAGVTLFGDGSLVQVGNTIIAGNNGGVDITIQNNGTLISRGGNVVGNGNGVVAFTQPKDQTEVSDPQLGPLTDNGGPTLTHEPLASSPAVNTGLNSNLDFEIDLDGDGEVNRITITEDQRGAPRIAGERVEAGAVELLGVIQGTNDDDFLLGTDLDDTIEGLAGNDLIKGANGNDDLDGGADDDSLQGAPGEDTIRGGTGNDTIDAGRDPDVLLGGPDNDVLIGGRSNDTLIGGDGRDEFQFLQVKDRRDVITDFKPEADFITVANNGFGGNLSEGTLDDDLFVSLPRFTDLDDNFTLGFVHATEVERLAFIDAESDIPLTQLAILEGNPELAASNFRIF